MSQEDRRRHAVSGNRPLDQFGRVGVRGEAIESYHASSNSDVLAVHPNGLRPFQQSPASGSSSLVTSEHNQVLRIPR